MSDRSFAKSTNYYEYSMSLTTLTAPGLVRLCVCMYLPCKLLLQLVEVSSLAQHEDYDAVVLAVDLSCLKLEIWVTKFVEQPEIRGIEEITNPTKLWRGAACLVLVRSRTELIRSKCWLYDQKRRAECI